MKQKTGFTLVELLAVIVILAIVLIIAVPGVLSIINKTKDNAYDRQVDMIKDAAKNYVTANTITWSGENPKSTVVTLDMLQSSGYLDKKILDPRNKKEILCVNVLVSKDNKNKVTYDVDMACNGIQPITPRVGSGMIPIVYKDGNWVKADVSNKNFAWFNYGDQQWANVATVTEDVRQTLLDAPVDTVVPMDKINAMFTWIPRFKYKLFNVDGTVSPVGNKNLAGNYMIDIKFETASTTKSIGTQNGQWLTHPAFTFGGQELEGFWVGKFESGYKEATDATPGPDVVDVSKLIIKPNSYSWRGINFANAFYVALSMKNGIFGVEASSDPHMTKNMEWGAMAYLTNSRYGKTGNTAYEGVNKEVAVNNNDNYLTGDGNYQIHIEQSTTGNITGIYDTSGGAWDYVSSIMKYKDRLYLGNTTFTVEQLQSLLDQNKYFDVYEYSTDLEDRSRGHLGDATTETGPFSANSTAWYEDYSLFLYDRIGADKKNNSFNFRRGVNSGNTTIAGIMAHHASTGEAVFHGGFRITLV